MIDLDGVNLTNFIESIVVILVALGLLTAIEKGHNRYEKLHKENKEMNTIVKVGNSIMRTLIILFAVLFILQLNGVNVSSLIAGLGLMSAIVGLALQDLLKDAIMGIHMMSDHFFSLGDVVRYGNIIGVVTSFTMKTTTIKSIEDNSVTSICNRNISEITKYDAPMMLDLDITFAYKDDYEKVDKLLYKVCDRLRGIDGVTASEYKGTNAFADTGCVYKVRMYCRPEWVFDIKRKALRVVQEELKANHMSIPCSNIFIND